MLKLLGIVLAALLFYSCSFTITKNDIIISNSHDTQIELLQEQKSDTKQDSKNQLGFQ